MTISKGFYKKVEKWLAVETTDKGLFRPFQANGNPYRANLFLVNVAPSPVLESEREYFPLLADALVNATMFDELYGKNCVSREHKGSMQFAHWLQEALNEVTVITSLNAYQINDIKELKHIKKQNPIQYKRGQAIFDEVLTEFQPKIMILQGKATVDEFKTRFGERLILINTTATKIQDLEAAGLFALLQNEDGTLTEIYATRSMAYFGKDGASFTEFKKLLKKSLKKL